MRSSCARRLSRTPLALGVLLLALPGAVEGQSSATPFRLSLAEAESRAVSEGQETSVIRERIRQAESEITRIRAGAFPDVSANVAYQRSIRSLFDGISFGGSDGDGAPATGGSASENGSGENGGSNPFAELPFGRRNTWIAGVRVVQPVYAAGRVSIGLDIADKVREGLRLELAEAEADLRLQVREAYFQAVFTELLVEIASEALALASDQLGQVEGFRAQGIAAELDVLTARVERDNLEPRLVEARNAARLARLNLFRLAELAPDAQVELVTALDADVAPVDRAALLDALTARPLVASARTGIAIREDQVRLARSGYLPTVGAFLDLGFQSFPSGFFPGEGGWREDWNAGFQIAIPVFNGFRTRAEISVARSDVRQAELETERLLEGLRLEAEAALADADAALSQVSARRGTVEEARRAVGLAELRFSSGSGTALELSNTRLLLQQARVNEAEALLRYVTALARLERASGGSLPLLRDRLRETRGS
jgi:outer membrane protein